MPILTPSAVSAFSPPGLECQLYFNGLTLNDKSAYDAYVVSRLTGLDDADIRDGREPFPDHDGELVMPAFYSGRNVTISGYIRALNMSTLRQMQGRLRTAFWLLEESSLLFLTGDTATDVFLNCRKNQPLSMVEEQVVNHHRRDFLISLRASDPRFGSYLQTTTSSGLNPASPATITCTNNGNVPSEPDLRITGPFTTLSITNPVTMAVWALDASVPDGEVWYASGRNHTLVRQTDGLNKYGSILSSSTWLTIDPGDNALSMTSTGGTANSQVEVVYRSSWM